MSQHPILTEVEAKELAASVLEGKPKCGSYVIAAERLSRFVEHTIVLPGWVCAHCGVFNGSAKEILLSCRACTMPLGSVPAVEANS